MSTPKKATPGGSGQANANQETENVSIVVDIDAERKAFSTMQARVAMRGCTLHQLADGSYLIGRSGSSKTATSLRDVGDVLRTMGSPS